MPTSGTVDVESSIIAHLRFHVPIFADYVITVVAYLIHNVPACAVFFVVTV